MPLVIGIGGHLAAGKDVVADHLVDTHGFIKLGMSDPLARSLYILNPLIQIAGDSDIVKEQFIFGQFYSYQDIIDMVGYVEAKTIPEVRSWLQKLGTEVGREILGKDTWVKAAEQSIWEELGTDKDVVITGIRFPNELEMIHNFNLYERAASVWVERPGLERDKNASAHASEGSVRPQEFDYILTNDKDIKKLQSAADELLEDIRA